jgi:hypothetical protein
MFAPKIAKAQTKAPDSPTRKLVPRPSTLVARPLRGGAVEQAQMLQGTIGNQALLRYLTQRLSNLPAKGPAEQHEQEAAPENMTAREASRGPSWDFSKIPVFPLDRSDRPQPSSPLAATPLPGAIQAKLAVGQVNDPLEHEADRVADQVMRMSDPAPSIATEPPQINRKCTACEEEEKSTLQTKSAATAKPVGEAPAIVHEALRSPGQPLDARARDFLEPRFSRGFGAVRVHSDPVANQSAERIGALAYTAGHHIAFAAGRYAPSSVDGLKLIAHELAHVTQQEGAGRLVQRQPQAQAQTRPAQNQDYRDYVQSTISYLNGSADFFGDPVVRIDEARFERVINGWYAMVTDREQMIDTQLGGDRALKDALHAAYIRAIRALIGRAVALFGKTETELYRVNSGRIPMWAWQVPHHMEPGITTPIAAGRTVDPLTGRVEFRVGGFDVSILPDTTDNRLSTPGETSIHVQFPGTPAYEWRGGRGGRIVTRSDPVARPTIEIQTAFRPGVSPQGQSGYGRGTTPEDVAGGRVSPRSTRLGFHEGSHGLAYLEFLAANPAPTFAGAVGMTEAAFLAAGRAFRTAWTAYIARINDFSIRVVDCVGLTKEQFEQANPPHQGVRFRCPR